MIDGESNMNQFAGIRSLHTYENEVIISNGNVLHATHGAKMGITTNRNEFAVIPKQYNSTVNTGFVRISSKLRREEKEIQNNSKMHPKTRVYINVNIAKEQQRLHSDADLHE